MKYAEECCCGCTLQTGVLILSALEIIGGVSSFVYMLLHPQALEIAYGITGIIFIALGITGWMGAQGYDKTKLKIFFYGEVFRMVFSFILECATMGSAQKVCEQAGVPEVDIEPCSRQVIADGVIRLILILLLGAYFVWITFSFWKKVDNGELPTREYSQFNNPQGAIVIQNEPYVAQPQQQFSQSYSTANVSQGQPTQGYGTVVQQPVFVTAQPVVPVDPENQKE
eukprot:TRINITY_DN1753_c0_g1_i2.p1 TRINITY_DN1753_c0_g1~~TRINITY_DN1753_c0_g1_i2.p1  ORF type:complete len:239 (-),score=51.55 TRINITY_DN1753_c0_g1_i2:28-705(-)